MKLDFIWINPLGSRSHDQIGFYYWVCHLTDCGGHISLHVRNPHWSVSVSETKVDACIN